MRHVGYVDPHPVSIAGALNRDRIVEIPGVGAVYRDRRKMTQVPAFAGLPERDGLRLLIDLLRKLAGGPDRSEKRLVDVARIFRSPDDAR
jgi:hypothetical protein